MSTVKEIFDSLTPEEKKQLIYSLNQEIGQIVKLSDGRFIGVNIHLLRGLLVDQKQGVWSLGTLK